MMTNMVKEYIYNILYYLCCTYRCKFLFLYFWVFLRRTFF